MVHFQSSSSKAPAPIFLLGDGDKEVLFLMFAILACFCSISSCFFNSSSLSIASAFSCYAFLIFLISCAFFSFSWTSGGQVSRCQSLRHSSPGCSCRRSLCVLVWKIDASSEIWCLWALRNLCFTHFVNRRFSFLLRFAPWEFNDLLLLL